MTNVFGSAAPDISIVADDTVVGGLQIGHAFVVDVPCVVTHVRYYVADPVMATRTGGSLDYYVWRQGEPGTTITGSLTIPGSIGWVTDELSPHLTIPAGRRFAAAVSFAAGPQSYGASYAALPAQRSLIQLPGSKYLYSAGTFNAYDVDSWAFTTSYLIDVEVAVSEMVNLAPADMADGDVLQIRRTINGSVNSISAITDAYTVNLHVSGGPLDGEDVDVWVPDTANGLAAADMQLLKEVPDSPFGSQWESSDGALWVYQGGGVYDCFSRGSSFPEGAKTTRAATPSLTPWVP
jgi:hypothetical protein